MMKKILSFFVAVMLLVSLMAVTGFAAGTTSVYGETKTAEAGKTVTLNFYIKGNTGFDSSKMTVSVAAPLTVTNITKGLMSGGAVNVAAGIINHASAEAVAADGVLFSVQIAVAANAGAGTYPVNLNVTRLNVNGESLNYTVAGGAVVIEAEETEAPTQKPTEAPTTEPTEGPTTEPVKPGDDDVPQTGDMAGLMVFGAVAMISMVAGAAYVCKRKFAK